MTKLGDNIKALREQYKMTIKELSEKSKVGQSTISEIETGKATNPKSDTLNKIADSFNIPIDLLFQDDPTNVLGKSISKELIKESNAAYNINDVPIKGLHLVDAMEKEIRHAGAVLDFGEPEQVVKYILEQPMFMAYGGYNLKEMSQEEILEVAEDMLFAMKLSLEKRRNRNK